MSSVAAVSLAAKGSERLIGHIINLRVLRSLGVVSYGIYLFHNVMPAGLIVLRDNGYYTESPLFGLPDLGIKAFLTISVAYLSWCLFEKPINSFKRHFPYSPRGARIETENRQAVDGNIAKKDNA
ncbi:hypothetical protein [Parasphingorhabdus sp.]|uniref:acyltransferase family protein n=1 Tax=Parasphingorhabdus sp. TaxID=2709688 RepID=UPI0032EE20CD